MKMDGKELSVEAGVAEVVVLRLLNGPWGGCEYLLPAGVTLFVAAPVDDGSVVPTFPDGAIVIPVAGGENFEVVVDEAVLEGCVLRMLGEGGGSRFLEWQQPCEVGAVCIAVRPIDAQWDTGIICPAPAADVPQGLRGVWWRRVLLAVLALTVLVLLGLLGWRDFMDDGVVAEVAAVVSGAPSGYLVLGGSDGVVYLFADRQRDVAWARQALWRSGKSVRPTRVSTFGEERERVLRLIADHYPGLAFRQLRFDRSGALILMVSEERARIDATLRASLQHSLETWMPYAKRVDIQFWRDAMLDASARAGLDAIGEIYQRVACSDGVVYQLSPEMSDVEMQRTQAFVEDFKRRFGEQYVSFVFGLKDDVAKGHSFKYGPAGYIKLARGHWLFP